MLNILQNSHFSTSKQVNPMLMGGHYNSLYYKALGAFYNLKEYERASIIY